MTEFSENVARKLEETVAENRGLDSEMRGLLRDLRSLLLYTELELKETHEMKWVISLLKVAVQLAKDYVFSGVLEGGEKEDQDLFGKITDLIKDGDVGQIYEALNYLKFAAQNYLNHTVRPSQGRIIDSQLTMRMLLDLTLYCWYLLSYSRVTLYLCCHSLLYPG